MNTASVAAAAIPASLVLISGSGLLAVRSAVRRGYAVVLSGPSLRFEPSRPLALAAAEAVTAAVPAGRTMTRRQAAAALGVGEKRVLSLGRSGDLEEIPQGPGRAVLVTAESVERLLAASAPVPPQEVA